MSAKPSEKPAWIPSDDPTKIIEPSASKKNAGWGQEEKPPFQYFNWFWNNLSDWINYFAGNSKYNIIIDSDTDEGDYLTLAAYIADSPTTGDRVLVKVDETITATVVVPAGVLIHQLKDKALTAATVFTPLITLGDGSVLEGDFSINSSHAGTIAKGISINGDGARVDNAIIKNTSTGTLTDPIYVEAAKTRNIVSGEIENTGAGAITNSFTDASTNTTNLVVVRSDTDMETTINAAQINGLIQTTLDIGDWNMDSTTTVVVASGLTASKIRHVEVSIRNDTGLANDNIHPLNFSPTAATVAGFWKVVDTDIVLSRVSSGEFDNTEYDATSYNRGWVTIWHTP